MGVKIKVQACKGAGGWVWGGGREMAQPTTQLTCSPQHVPCFAQTAAKENSAFP